jgi:peptide/nickel transport system substrate-binding protein
LTILYRRHTGHERPAVLAAVPKDMLIGKAADPQTLDPAVIQRITTTWTVTYPHISVW